MKTFNLPYRQPLLAALLLLPSLASANTLVFCSEASPDTFNGAMTTTGVSMDASSKNVFNRLMEFKIGTTVLEPGLAERYEVSKDGTEYTFYLRHGVKFHKSKYFTPTRDFNADDVLFSFNRQLLKDHPYHKVNGGVYEYFDGMGMNKLIKDIIKVDDYTVKFVLNRPEAPFLANLGMDFASIQSAEYAAQLTKANKQSQIDVVPIGTGPFQFVNYKKDAIIRYKAHPDYWRGRAKIDNLVFAITPDAQVRFQKMKAGECHISFNPNPNNLAAYKADKNINLMSQPGLNIGYLAFNTEHKPFDDVRVRHALSMAINKQAIIDSVYKETATVAKNPYPPTIWSYNNAIKDDVYDPAAAKKLLEEAGVKGFKTTVWAMPVSRAYMPNGKRIAELIQADWRKIGVDAKIVSFEWGEYLERSQKGEHDAILLGWIGDNGDPDNFLGVLLSCDAKKSGSNRARWCNKEFDDLLTKAKLTSDIQERTALYEKAQVLFKAQEPWATLAHTVTYQPVNVKVKNWKIDPLGGNYFYPVELTK